MNIRVRYFAALREQAGKSEEGIEFTGKTPGDLWKILSARYGFTLDSEFIKAAINDEYVAFDTEIQENDLVVFIPPVAGG